jgi:hypothetical protein
MARTVEQMYPDRRARKVADESIDGLPLDATMLEYIVAWEAAYLAAGGNISL